MPESMYNCLFSSIVRVKSSGNHSQMISELSLLETQESGREVYHEAQWRIPILWRLVQQEPELHTEF